MNKDPYDLMSILTSNPALRPVAPRPRAAPSTRPPAPPAQPPQTTRAPVCGVDCHRHGRWGGLTVRALGAAALLAGVVFCVSLATRHPAQAPGWGGGGSSQIYAHNPGYGAAAVAGEARGAAHAVGHAARWGLRGARMGRRGSFSVPGFHGFGFGIFSGF